MKTIAVVLVLLFSPLAHAAVLIESITNPIFTASDTQSLGYAFTANEMLEVTSLGYIDKDDDGLLASHDVGLWNSSAHLLAQVSVMPSSPLTDGFRYASLSTPVVIEPGETYYLAGETNGDVWVYLVDSFTISPAFTFGGFYYAMVSGGMPGPATLTFPETSAGSNPGTSYLNVNLQANAVPEPQGIALTFLGFVVVAAVFLRRRRTRDAI